jgi:8-oxo-dGTP diphosphatase
MPEIEQLFLDSSLLEPAGANFQVNLEFAVFRVSERSLEIFSLPTGLSPFEGDMALPFKRVEKEDLETTAKDYLIDELHLGPITHLEQVTSYSTSKPDSPVRQLNLLFLGVLGFMDENSLIHSKNMRGSFSLVSDIRNDNQTLSPHDQHMILLAHKRLSTNLQDTTLATQFCPKKFTLGQLRSIYESVWSTKLDPANFRRKVLKSTNFVEYVSRMPPTHKHGRPAHLYQGGSLTHFYPGLPMPNQS